MTIPTVGTNFLVPFTTGTSFPNTGMIQAVSLMLGTNAAAIETVVAATQPIPMIDNSALLSVIGTALTNTNILQLPDSGSAATVFATMSAHFDSSFDSVERINLQKCNLPPGLR